VFVTDRVASEAWYGRVLGLARVPDLENWATDGGPLTLSNATGEIHLALFERSAQPCRSTIALGVSGSEFLAWREHLAIVLGSPIQIEDHQLSWSLYLADPDGNPYEITTYEYGAVSKRLEA
jgi:catechol-2,3-dioxygenase